MRALVLLVALALCSPLRASADDTPAAPPPLEQEGAPEPLPEPPATTAEGVHYTGAHPLGDGGYCYETGAHVHEAAPAEPQLYDLVLVAVGRSPNGRKIGADISWHSAPLQGSTVRVTLPLPSPATERNDGPPASPAPRENASTAQPDYRHA